MATMFSASNVQVACRYWGGPACGVRVEIYTGFGTAGIDGATELSGDDGSVETLATLAQQVGNGACSPGCAHVALPLRRDGERHEHTLGCASQAYRFSK